MQGKEGQRGKGESTRSRANGHGVSATPENQHGTKSVAAAMTLSLTPALSQWAGVTGSALRAPFIVRMPSNLLEQVLKPVFFPGTFLRWLLMDSGLMAPNGHGKPLDVVYTSRSRLYKQRVAYLLCLRGLRLEEEGTPPTWNP
jgi:hypothetical protein